MGVRLVLALILVLLLVLARLYLGLQATIVVFMPLVLVIWHLRLRHPETSEAILRGRVRSPREMRDFWRHREETASELLDVYERGLRLAVRLEQSERPRRYAAALEEMGDSERLRLLQVDAEIYHGPGMADIVAALRENMLRAAEADLSEDVPEVCERLRLECVKLQAALAWRGLPLQREKAVGATEGNRDDGL